MCDPACVNLLREKVRQLQAEEKRLAAFSDSSSERFVPWIMPVRSQLQAGQGLDQSRTHCQPEAPRGRPYIRKIGVAASARAMNER
jgi:hypothetical protein